MPFSASRLTLARQRRRMTRLGLGRVAVVPARRVAAAEAGELEPTDDEVQRFAGTLRFPVSFFGADELEPIEPGRASFRALASMSARLRDSVLACAAVAIEMNHKLEADFKLPGPNLLDLSGEDPERAAAVLRAYWGIGVQPAPNMVHLLEQHGVRVFSLAEDCREVDAFALWDGATPYVFLNTLKSAEHGRWDAAHELGHLVMHRASKNQGKEAEAEANRFAAAFLIPECGARSYFGMPSPDDLVRNKKRWGVSAVALARRQRDVGAMPDPYYTKLMIEMSIRGWRRSEPEGLPRETSQLFEKVFRFWREDGLTPAAIAEQLHLHPDDLSALVFGRVLHTIQGQGQVRQQVPARHGLRLV